MVQLFSVQIQPDGYRLETIVDLPFAPLLCFKKFILLLPLKFIPENVTNEEEVTLFHV